jgi:hypothetical protein
MTKKHSLGLIGLGIWTPASLLVVATALCRRVGWSREGERLDQPPQSYRSASAARRLQQLVCDLGFAWDLGFGICKADACAAAYY